MQNEKKNKKKSYCGILSELFDGLSILLRDSIGFFICFSSFVSCLGFSEIDGVLRGRNSVSVGFEHDRRSLFITLGCILRREHEEKKN